MRRQQGYGVLMACVLTWAGAGAAEAQEPTRGLDGLVLQNGVEIHLPTPPEAKLRGADIRVHSWDPSRSSRIPVKPWVPGAPSQIPVADWRTADPSRIPLKGWEPLAPSRIPVKSWEPGRPSRIRVHGPY